MDGKMTLFDGVLTDICEVKPEVGAELIFWKGGHEYPCVVETHCGYDYFYVRFTDRTPADDSPDYGECEGWHLSLRGYKDNWKFKKARNRWMSFSNK